MTRAVILTARRADTGAYVQTVVGSPARQAQKVAETDAAWAARGVALIWTSKDA